MLTDLLILISAAIAAGAVLYLSIFLLNNMRTRTEELKRIENQIDDVPHLPIQTEGAFGTKSIKNDGVIIKTLGIKSPSEVLKCDALEKGILTVNDVRKIAGIEPFNEFQKVAHDFGDTTKAVNVGGSTIRRAYNCKNCGGNLFENNICCYCGTLYKND